MVSCTAANHRYLHALRTSRETPIKHNEEMHFGHEMMRSSNVLHGFAHLDETLLFACFAQLSQKLAKHNERVAFPYKSCTSYRFLHALAKVFKTQVFTWFAGPGQQNRRKWKLAPRISPLINVRERLVIGFLLNFPRQFRAARLRVDGPAYAMDLGRHTPAGRRYMAGGGGPVL